MSAIATLRRRPSLAAAALYAVLALLFVAPALVPGRTLASTDLLWSITPWTADRPDGVRDLGANWEMADSVAQFQPFLAYTRERLPDIPLWNPYIEGGRPFNANMQSAIFSPFSWPAYLLPFWWSLGLIGALKLWVPAFGMFLLARRLGQSVGASLLGGRGRRVRALPRGLARVAALERVGVAAVGAAVDRPCGARADAPGVRGAGGPRRAAVLRRASGDELPRARRRVPVRAAARAAADPVLPRGCRRRHRAGRARADSVHRVARALVRPVEPRGPRPRADAAAVRARARPARTTGGARRSWPRSRSSSRGRSTRVRCR